jgi:hypothetical protein
MIKELFIVFFPVLILVIACAFIIAKLAAMSSVHLKHHRFEVFIRSLRPVSRQGLRNTFNEKQKKYYELSNKINPVFYAAIAGVTLIYLLLYSI